MKLISVDVPQTVPMPFTNRLQVTRDMTVIWVNAGQRRSLTVHKGYLTDGASIPKPLWSVIGSPYQPRFITAAIFHDKMCDLDWEVVEMSDLFKLLLIDSNVSKSLASIMTASVRAYKTLT